jgi:hypothetical protein
LLGDASGLEGMKGMPADRALYRAGLRRASPVLGRLGKILFGQFQTWPRGAQG